MGDNEIWREFECVNINAKIIKVSISQILSVALDTNGTIWLAGFDFHKCNEMKISDITAG
ncbi:MAG: hypothetical protein LBB59_03480 [Campylobacteraceae bacterium]|nr:hypothetical protein [Campylobacteraceae bacterium]